FLAIFDHASAPRCTHLSWLAQTFRFQISNLKFAISSHDLASFQRATFNFQSATASGVPKIPCLLSPSLLSKVMLKFYGVLLLSIAVASAADAPARKYVRTPPEGIPIPTEIKSELESGVSSLGHEIDDLKKSLQSKPDVLALLPDVQI